MIARLALQEIPEQLPEPDLPGGVAAIVRAIFSVPQWIQISGAILGAIVAAALVVLIWKKRAPILEWLRTRSRAIQVGLVALAAVVLIAVATAGTVSWDYMQHDNDFCTGCHVMGSSFQRFTESGHAELSCHDCHRQSIFASTRQLVLWVRDRPEEIGEHSPVPTAICSECHVNDDPEDDWPQIAATAGHLVHLQSDSSALADVQCVTCHGLEVHQFVPAEQTCGQAGCHQDSDTQIVLGAMSDATGLHCAACHEFTAEPIIMSGIDSTTGPLSPGLNQCTSCHEMAEMFEGFDPLADPHEARCGACHNPHEQETPEVALRTCTDSGCHARPDTLSTFHVGIPDSVAAACADCHLPHTWTRDGDDCASCHTDIAGAAPGSRAAGGMARSNLPGPELGAGSAFRHLAATFAVVSGPAPRGPSPGPDASFNPGLARHLAPGALQQEAFSHDEHADVACTECHSNRTRHGEVTVRTETDCYACHHSTRTAGTVGCGDCHTAAELGRVRNVAAPLRLDVWEAERARSMPFDHDPHAELRCVECHGGGIQQTVQTSCASCHEEHHPQTANTACVSCHEEHREDAHTAVVHTDGCTGAGCHQEARFSQMERTRAFCSVCHQEMVTHEPQGLCTDCHLVPTGEPRPEGP